MKSICTILFICLSISLYAQTDESNYMDKVKTLDSTIENLYDVISGEKGEERDWALFKFLFHPEAKLIPSSKNKEGNINARFISPQDYIDSSGQWLIDNGFFEKEIHRHTDRFGNIAQVFTTYHAFRSESDDAPFYERD